MATSDSPLNVPDVTLAVARPAVGGDITGLSVTALDGSIAHGNRVRIEAEASYAIGSKTQAAPRHWEMGGDVILNGTPVTQAAIGSSPSTAQVWGAGEGTSNTDAIRMDNFSLRHARADRYYEMRQKAYLSSPASMAGATTKEQQRSLMFWARWNASCNWTDSRAYVVSGSITGTFDFPAGRRRRGEQCVMTTGDGLVSRDVYIHFVYNDGVDNWITIEPIGWAMGGSDPGTSDFYSGTITGNTSGASATFGLSHVLETSPKFWRFGQNRDLNPHNYITCGANGSGQYFYRAVDGAGTLLGEAASTGASPDNTPETWQLFGAITDFNGDFRTDALYLGSELRYSNSSLSTSYFNDHPGDEGMGIDLVGFEIAAPATLGVSCWMGEIYMDNDTRILFSCDSTTFGGSTEVEPLRPDAWTENADGSVVIDAYLYQGGFASMTGKYLALLDGDTVIFEGVAI